MQKTKPSVISYKSRVDLLLHVVANFPHKNSRRAFSSNDFLPPDGFCAVYIKHIWDPLIRLTGAARLYAVRRIVYAADYD